jgi:cysteine desulfurase
MKPIYLDNCATTQPYPEVVKTIVDMLTDNFGNPSSLHSHGRRAKEILEASRRSVAEALGAHPEEIFFTSGGTEADNLAVLGVSDICENAPGHIVTTTVEHPAVYKPLRHLRRNGWKIDYIPIQDGNLDMRKACDAITPDTCLTSVMFVNNETGTILPVHEIGQIIDAQAPFSLLHCDAVQAFGKIRFTADSLGADLISISGHKIHGPKGIGALYIRSGTKIQRRVFGGDQEKGMRSGTEAIPLIAGFAEAVRITMSRLEDDVKHMHNLREYALRRLPQMFPDVLINSPKDGAPHIVNFSLPRLKSSEAAMYLSENDISVSTSAACKTNHVKGPSMMMYFGLSAEMADSTIRVGLSSDNTEDEIEFMLHKLNDYRKYK